MSAIWDLLDWIWSPLHLDPAPRPLPEDPSARPNPRNSLSLYKRLSGYGTAPGAVTGPDFENGYGRQDEHDRQLIEELQQQNAALGKRATALTQELQVARAAAERSKRELDQHAAQTARLKEQNASLGHALSQAQDFIRHQHSELGRLQAENDGLRSSSVLSTRALREQTSEMHALRSFLNKTDSWTGSQILQAVTDLNSEIVQLAAMVSDEFAPSLDRAADHTRPSDHELVLASMGRPMRDLLATRDHAADPTLVQFAVQAWEVYCCAQVLEAFCFGLPSEVNEFMAKVFSRMHEAEPQPTSSRWRSLAHVHSRAVAATLSRSPQPNPADPDIQTQLHIRGILAILALAGCTASDGVHREPLRVRYGAAIGRIVARVADISRILSEEVMSACFQVVRVPSKSSGSKAVGGPPQPLVFDEASMEDVFQGVAREERCRVLCAVEFGLACTKRKDEVVEEIASPTTPVTPLWNDKPNGSVNGSMNGRPNGAANGHPEGLPNGHANGFTNGSANGHADGLPNGSANGSAGVDHVERQLLLKPKVLLESVREIL